MESIAPTSRPKPRALNAWGWTLVLGILVAPTSGAAQGTDVATLLAGRLPADVEDAVLERIGRAEEAQLPTGPLTDLVLQGVTKGRSGDEVLAALDGFVGDLTQARAALARGGAAPTHDEVEAATMAMRMGADGDAVSSLARSRPGGRSLAVPLLVLGGLTQRGLPSDQALGRVVERLSARADDAELLDDLPPIPGGPGVGRPGLQPPAGPFGPNGLATPGHAGQGGPPVGPRGGGRPVGLSPAGRPGPGGF